MEFEGGREKRKGGEREVRGVGGRRRCIGP